MTGDGVAIAVLDTGVGIAPAALPTALAPLGRVHESHPRGREGIGLGLPICHALAELHGGRLAVESAPNRGTSATVFLPENRVLRTAIAR